MRLGVDKTNIWWNALAGNQLVGFEKKREGDTKSRKNKKNIYQKDRRKGGI